MNVKIFNPTNRNTRLVGVTIDDIDLYFSYETCVAFRTPTTGLVVCENVWSNTTGRHLNEIDGGNKTFRIPYIKFSKYLEAL